MAREQTEVRELQEGNYVMINDTPSVITAYSTSKPGKHGSAKARVEGQGVFDGGQNRNFTNPVDAKVWVPIITRKQGQVVSTSPGEMQVMDLETYDTFTMRVPDDESLSPDENIEYLEYEAQRKIV